MGGMASANNENKKNNSWRKRVEGRNSNFADFFRGTWHRCPICSEPFFHHHQQNHTTSPYTLDQDKSSTEAVLQKHSAVHRCWPLYEKPLHGINSALLGHVAMLRGQQRWSKRKKINWQNQIEGGLVGLWKNPATQVE